MKKRYAFTFLFALFSFALLRAQAYYPMLDSAINEWTYASQMFGVAQQQPSGDRADCTLPFYVMVQSDAREYTTTDTILDSLTYKIVLHEEYGSPCLFGYMREDTAARRVYFRSHQDTAEYVLYDFSLQPGDSMYFTFASFSVYPTGWYELDSISTVNITAGSRPAFYFNSPNSPASFIVIESVGWQAAMNYRETTEMYVGGPFSMCAGYQHQFNQFLACFNHSSHVYFDTCAYNIAVQMIGQGVFLTDSCNYSYFSGGIEENSLISSLELQPNPAGERVNLVVDLQQASETTIRIYEISGRLISTQQQPGKAPAGKSTFEVNISALPQGAYFVECATPSGSVFRKLMVQR